MRIIRRAKQGLSPLVFVAAMVATSTTWGSVEAPEGIQHGTWDDFLPIEVPSAPGGASPQVQLRHDHRMRDSVVGAGYQLQVGSVITRHSALGGAPVLWDVDAESMFRLDGERLVWVDPEDDGLDGWGELERGTAEGVRPRESTLRSSLALRKGSRLGSEMTLDTAFLSLFGGRFEPANFTGMQLRYDPGDNVWIGRNMGWTWIYGSRDDTGVNATKKTNRAPMISAPLDADGLARVLQESMVGSARRRLSSSSVDGKVAGQAQSGGLAGCDDGKDLCRTVAWYLSLAIDPHGNAIRYDYTVPELPANLDHLTKGGESHDHLMDVISYADEGKRVEFTYVNRKEPRFSSISGLPTVRFKRLSRIRSYVGDALFSDYELVYEDDEQAGALPRQALLVEVLRRSNDSGVSRSLRRLVRATPEPAWPSLDDTEDVSETVTQPDVFGSSGKRVGIPITLNLNGDGRSDLIVLSWFCDQGGCRDDHRAYIAGDNGDLQGRDQVGSREGRILEGWEERLSVYLDGAFAETSRGYLLSDVNGDGWSDLIVEKAAGDEELGEVILVRSISAESWAEEPLPALPACTLRSGQLGDVDGDGLADLIRLPRIETDVCEARNLSRWVRNSGSSPYYVWAEREPLGLPLERVSLPNRYVDVVAESCDGLETRIPSDYSRNDDAWASTSNLARFADYNSDGLLDVAYSFPACREWRDDVVVSCGMWVDVPESLYSEIHFGKADGTFVATGLELGESTYEFVMGYAIADSGDGGQGSGGRLDPGDFRPDLLDPDLRYPSGTAGTVLEPGGESSSGSADSPASQPPSTQGAVQISSSGWCVPSWRSRASLTADLDRSGFAELIRNDDTEAYRAGRFRGAELGFDLSAESPLPTEIPLTPTEEFEYSEHELALGDFDGDGFVDFFLLDVHPWNARIAFSRQTVAEGRVTRSRASWGGWTDLEWGFSAESPHDNPVLAANLEVLEELKGIDGATSFSYGGGRLSSDGFRGFGRVEATNERGAHFEYGFYTERQRAGLGSYGVRYRADGSIDHVSVSIRGTPLRDGGFLYSLLEPHFNPLIRRCEYSVGRPSRSGGQSVSAEGLIDQCHDFELAPLRPFEEFLEQRSPLVLAGDRLVADRLEWLRVGGREESPDQQMKSPSPHGGRTPLRVREAFALSVSASSVLESRYPELVIREVDRPAEGLRSALRRSSNLLAEPWIGSLLGRERNPESLRWSVPSEFELPGVASAPPLTGPATTPVRETIVDFEYDHASRRLDRRIDYRDTSTRLDDLTTTYSWEPSVPGSSWFRLIEATVTDRVGERGLKVTREDFEGNGFDMAGLVRSCGRTDGSCRDERYEWNADGTLRQRLHSDGSRESWTIDPACGLPSLHVDAVGRQRRTTYDGLCRRIVDEWLGSETAFAHDGFNRVRTTDFDAGPASPPVTIYSLQRDTDLDEIDSSLESPRLARLRSDGQLELTFLDEYGRTTSRTLCENAGLAAPSSIDDVECAVGSELTTGWQGYSYDGQLTALTLEPYSDGDLPRTARLGRDEFGRLVTIQLPANSDPLDGPQWVLENVAQGVGWRTRTDPIGRVFRQEISSMSRKTLLNGETLHEELLNAFGSRMSLSSDGLTVLYDHDDHHQPVRERLDQQAPCWEGQGDGAEMLDCTHALDFGYDISGRLVRVGYADGSEEEVQLDAVGRPRAAWHSSAQGRQLLRSWRYRDGETSRIEETDESGAVLLLESDSVGRVTRRSLEGETTTTDYGVHGKPIAVTDANGLTTNFRYDIFDRLAEIEHPDSGITSYERDGAGRLLRRVDADGVAETYRYAYSGKLLTREIGRWTLEERTYDAVGRVVDEWSEGIPRRYLWSPRNQLERVDYAFDPQVNTSEVSAEFEYDSSNRLVRSVLSPVNSMQAVTEYTYNPWGWPIEITDPSGATEGLEYDAMGRLRFLEDGEGFRYESRFDGRGRTRFKTMPGADPLRFSYRSGVSHPRVGGNLRLVETEDGEGAVTSRFFDAKSRLVATRLADGTGEVRGYTGGLLKRRTALDESTQPLVSMEWLYDEAGRLESVTGPLTRGGEQNGGPAYRYDYTSAGRIASITTPSATTDFTYSEDGHLSEQRFGGQRREILRADVYPWATTITTFGEDAQESSRSLTLERDLLGRVVTSRFVEGDDVEERLLLGLDAVGNPASTVSRLNGIDQVRHDWTYSPLGRPLSRATSILNEDVGTTAWSYYKNGALESLSTPSGVSLRYLYGTPFDFRLRQIEDDGSRVVARFHDFDGRGRPLLIEVPSGRREYRFDSMDRLTGWRRFDPDSGEQVLGWSARFDPLGRIASQDSIARAERQTTDYTYDPLGRLSVERRSDRTTRYRWDPAGNLLSTEVERGAGRRQRMEAAYRGDRLLTVNGTSLEFDPWGATTRDQHGNRFARLPSGLVTEIRDPSGSGVEIVRDADGLPWAIGAPGSWDVDHWDLDPAGLPIESSTARGENRTYIEAMGMVLGRIDSGLSTGSVLKPADFTQDRAAIPEGVGARSVRNAFGFGIPAAWTEREAFQFHGMRSMGDLGPLHLARQRVYDAQTARFISQDPVDLLGGPHRYAYAGGDPVNWWDPMGLWQSPVETSSFGTEEVSTGAPLPGFQDEEEEDDWPEERRRLGSISDILNGPCPPNAICHPMGAGMVMANSVDAGDAENGAGDPADTNRPTPADAPAVSEDIVLTGWDQESQTLTWETTGGEERSGTLVAHASLGDGRNQLRVDVGDGELNDLIVSHGSADEEAGSSISLSGGAGAIEGPDGWGMDSQVGVYDRIDIAMEVGTDRVNGFVGGLSSLGQMAMNPIDTFMQHTPAGLALGGDFNGASWAMLNQFAMPYKMAGGVLVTGGRALVSPIEMNYRLRQFFYGQDRQTVLSGANGAVDSAHAVAETASMFTGVGAVRSTMWKGFSKAFGKPKPRLAKPPCGCSFAGDTLVLTPEGSRRIDAITDGDSILTRGEASTELQECDVVQTSRRIVSSTLDLVLALPDGSQETIRTTPEHPFWLKDGLWVEAGDLQIGDPVWTLHGWAEIALAETTWEKTPVYSLSVDEEKTFLAGETAAWVHNCICDVVESLEPGMSIRGPESRPRSTLNRFRGFWGESWAKERLLVNDNLIQVVGEQVRVRTPAQGLRTYRVLDYLVRTKVNIQGLPKGTLIAIEVKAGNAVRSTMQRLKDIDLLNDPATTWMNRKRIPYFDDSSGGRVFLNYGLPTGPIHTLVLRVPESAMPKNHSFGGVVDPL